MEVWKDIPALPNCQVSTLGNVRNINCRGTGKSILYKTVINKDGYEYVRLYYKTYKVHRLVALTFLDPIDDKPIVDHINRNRLDNNVSNLRYCTYVENNNNRALPASGHRNISSDHNSYTVQIKRNGIYFKKTVPTLEEAIQTRDDYLLSQSFEDMDLQ